jgi:hypothetical protein
LCSGATELPFELSVNHAEVKDEGGNRVISEARTVAIPQDTETSCYGKYLADRAGRLGTLVVRWANMERDTHLLNPRAREKDIEQDEAEEEEAAPAPLARPAAERKVGLFRDFAGKPVKHHPLVVYGMECEVLRDTVPADETVSEILLRITREVGVEAPRQRLLLPSVSEQPLRGDLTLGQAAADAGLAADEEILMYVVVGPPVRQYRRVHPSAKKSHARKANGPGRPSACIAAASPKLSSTND